MNFLNERMSCYNSIPFRPIQFTRTYTVRDDGNPVYYIFSVEGKGYAIISADDVVIPVLAYSFEGTYSESDQPPQFASWMNQYAHQISFARKNKASPSLLSTLEWNRLLGNQPRDYKLNGIKTEVLPLITSQWDQNSPYNASCPADTKGPGGHVYAGCVPTCLGQIMYYYRWPEKGTGSYTDIDTTYGSLNVDFDTTRYDWNNMKNSISWGNQGTAKLLYHLGVACDLVYGPSGSGMYNHKAAYALRTFFKYSPNTQYIFRDSTSINWDSLIIAHLNRKMPLYYAGWSLPEINGHAFVCDGYQDSAYFHFNFGWSGSFNGYFYIDNLTPGGNNFNLAQELIINIYPDTLHYVYPIPCNGLTTLKYPEGSLTDGSGPLHNYPSSIDCSWLIDPQPENDSISSIQLTFDRFSLNEGDTVRIYDGNSAMNSLLGSFSGGTLPVPLNSSGNKLMVRFTSTSATGAPGWSAGYSTTTPVWCRSTTTIIGDTADFTDGSFRFDYHNGSICKWKLLASDTLPLTIYFRRFDTEPENDYLKIYDLDTEELLANISGYFDSTALPLPVTASKGKMMIYFFTNGSVTKQGWEIYYPKSTIGISENHFQVLKIYPNPTKDILNFSFLSGKKQTLKVELINLNGKILLSEKFQLNSGINQNKISALNFSPGVFILRVSTDEESIIRKVVIE